MNRPEHVDCQHRNAEFYADPTAAQALAAAIRKNYPRIYISSPLRGDTARNTAKAIHYCRFALKRGKFPIAPHIWLPRFMDDADPGERELALSFGERLLCGCRDKIGGF